MELYEQVLKVAREYMGDKAEEFLERQCKLHIGVEPQNLSQAHLGSLGWWCFTSGCLTLDRPTASAFRKRIEGLKEAQAVF